MTYLYVTGPDAEEYSTGHARTWTLTLTVGHGSATYVYCDGTLRMTTINYKYKIENTLQIYARTGEGLMEAEKKAMSTRRIRNRDKQALSSCCQLTKIASCTENPQHCLSQVTEQKDGFGDDPILKRRTYVLHVSPLSSFYHQSYAELSLRAAVAVDVGLSAVSRCHRDPCPI